MNVFDEKYRARFEKLSTTNVSDACDFYNIHGATYGIRPMIEKWGRMVGRAVTVKMCAAGETKNKHHLGMNAIVAAEPGDIIVIDNGGRLDTSCWGGILANSAKMKKVTGTVIDGCCRDLDDIIDADYPVYARGCVVATARGRIMEQSTISNRPDSISNRSLAFRIWCSISRPSRWAMETAYSMAFREQSTDTGCAPRLASSLE